MPKAKSTPEINSNSNNTTALHRPIAIFALTLVGFAIILELPMIFTILPAIKLMGTPSLLQLHWIIASYILAISISLVTCWRLSDMWGRKWVLSIGLILFSLSSLSCALAHSAYAMILFRFLQGIGAAMILPNAIILLNLLYKPSESKQFALSCWGVGTATAFVAGAPIASILTKIFNWQSNFLLLFILSLISAILIIIFIKESVDKQLKEPLDIFGSVTFSLFLVFLTIAIIQGPSWGWASFLSIICFVISAVALYAFIYIQLKTDIPDINLKILNNRFYRACIFASISLATYLYGGLFIIPAYLYNLQGSGLGEIGFLLLAITLVAIIIQPLVRYLNRVIEHKLMFLIGIFLLILSAFLQMQFKAHMDLDFILFGILFMGLGLGFTWGTARQIVFKLFKNPANNHITTETIWSWQATSATIGVAITGSVFRQSLTNQVNNYLNMFQLNLTPQQHQVITNHFLNNLQIANMFNYSKDNIIRMIPEQVMFIYQSAFNIAFYNAMQFILGLSLATFIAIVAIKMFKD